MADPVGDYLRVSNVGSIAGGESWSVNHYQELGGFTISPTPAAMATCAAAVETAFETFWSTFKAHCSGNVFLVRSDIAWIRDGVTQAKASAAAASPIVGSGASSNPAYISRVISLLTNRAGRSYRGRVYLPYNGTQVSPGTTLWPSDSTTVGNFKTYLAAVQSACSVLAGAPGDGPIIYSRTSGSHEPVTALRMDNRPDTQRGRLAKVQPTLYDSVAYP